MVSRMRFFRNNFNLSQNLASFTYNQIPKNFKQNTMPLDFVKFSWINLLDIFMVSYLIYMVYHLIKGSIASKVFLGYLLVYVCYLVFKAVGLELLSKILGQFMNVGVLALLIIFQPEIRRFLLMVGRTTNIQDNRLIKRFFPDKTLYEKPEIIDEIVEASKTMASLQTGALIVIQREDELKRYIDSGDMVDSIVSKRMLTNIFFKNSPLHDGAVVIHEGRIKAARCMLPVSENLNISPSLGFRHRAAIGISEHTDAVVVVVSEEKGEISLVYTGGMFRNLTIEDLKAKLMSYMTEK